MAVVRISLGRFEPDQFETINHMLVDSQASLVPAIRNLKGNLAYYAGIDREHSAMTNVSVWRSLEDAMQMASLKAMQDLAGLFISAGVRFDRPITNHEVLWTV